MKFKEVVESDTWIDVVESDTWIDVMERIQMCESLCTCGSTPELHVSISERNSVEEE